MYYLFNIDEIEQDITETQEDNVNLQVLLEKAVKHQKQSDTFAAQIIKSIHSDISTVILYMHFFFFSLVKIKKRKYN